MVTTASQIEVHLMLGSTKRVARIPHDSTATYTIEDLLQSVEIDSQQVTLIHSGKVLADMHALVSMLKGTLKRNERKSLERIYTIQIMAVVRKPGHPPVHSFGPCESEGPLPTAMSPVEDPSTSSMSCNLCLGVRGTQPPRNLVVRVRKCQYGISDYGSNSTIMDLVTVLAVELGCRVQDLQLVNTGKLYSSMSEPTCSLSAIRSHEYLVRFTSSYYDRQDSIDWMQTTTVRLRNFQDEISNLLKRLTVDPVRSRARLTAIRGEVETIATGLTQVDAGERPQEVTSLLEAVHHDLIVFFRATRSSIAKE